MRTTHAPGLFMMPSQRTQQTLVATALVGLALVAAAGFFAIVRRPAGEFSWPLPNAEKRAIPLGFDMYVTPDPAQNPIDPPERFTGHHAAQDFEIIPGEEDKDVPVLASCTGPITVKQHAEGYGGVVVQRCELKGEPVTVLYGHLSLDGMEQKVGDTLNKGDSFAVLGAAGSTDSGFNRKHLHFGIHKGTDSVLLGYLQDRSQMDEFIDPMTVLGR